MAISTLTASSLLQASRVSFQCGYALRITHFLDSYAVTAHYFAWAVALTRLLPSLT